MVRVLDHQTGAGVVGWPLNAPRSGLGFLASDRPILHENKNVNEANEYECSCQGLMATWLDRLHPVPHVPSTFE